MAAPGSAYPAGVTTAPAGASAPLVVRTTRVDDPGQLLDLLPRSASLSWVRRGQGLVGWGEAARFASTGPDRFAAARDWWQGRVDHAVVRDEVGLPGSGPVAFGSFAFDARSPRGGVLVVPEVVVGARDGVCWVTTVSADGGLPAVPRLGRHRADAPGTVTYADGARSGAEWAQVVARAVDRIGRASCRERV